MGKKKVKVEEVSKRSQHVRPGDWVVDVRGNPQEVVGAFMVLQLGNGTDERHEINEMTLMAIPPDPEPGPEAG